MKAAAAQIALLSAQIIEAAGLPLNREQRRAAKNCKPIQSARRQVMADPVSYVINGFLPLREATTEVMRLRIANHGALESIVKGTGILRDAIMLRNAMVTTASLAEIGTGTDWLPEIEQGHQAINALILRGRKTGRYLFTGLELTAVNLAMEVHDAQIDGCTITQFEAAIKRSATAERCGHERKAA